VIQSVCGIFAVVATDAGTVFQMFYFATVAYWSLTALICIRHFDRLSTIDVLIVQWGFIVALVVIPLITALLWNLYGYL